MKDLTKGNIYKTFFVFGFPLVLSGMLSMAFNTVDTVIVGRFLGTKALAALGATSPLIMFVSALFWGYSVGCSIYMAKLFGAKEYQKLKSVFYSNIVFSFCLVIKSHLIPIISCQYRHQPISQNTHRHLRFVRFHTA